MIRSWCEALAQEPWGFHPDQIASLTDWQIVELYLRPAARRAEEFKKDLPAPPGAPRAEGPRPAAPPAAAPGDGPEGEPGGELHRRQVVGQAFMGVMGMSREQAEALYEQQLAEYHRMKAAGEL